MAVFHQREFQSLSPSQVVPRLADQGVYLASESTCYRVLHEAGEQHDRGRAKARQQRSKPLEYRSTGPNQAWSWDVTYLKGPARGLFFYLYLIVDIFSRKIVDWEVCERECGELASSLVRRTVMAEFCLGTPGFTLQIPFFIPPDVQDTIKKMVQTELEKTDTWK